MQSVGKCGCVHSAPPAEMEKKKVGQVSVVAKLSQLGSTLTIEGYSIEYSTALYASLPVFRNGTRAENAASPPFIAVTGSAARRSAFIAAKNSAASPSPSKPCFYIPPATQ